MFLKPIPKDVKERVVKRDNNICRICGKPGKHIHHLYGRNATIPRYIGIPQTPHNNHEFNLITVCSECHERIHRKGMTQHEREKFIVENMKRWNYGL